MQRIVASYVFLVRIAVKTFFRTSHKAKNKIYYG